MRRNDIVLTRPPAMNCKTGQEGRNISLCANYFRTIRTPKWSIYTYRVDFSPETVDRKMRQNLIRTQMEVFGTYLFDGTRVFSTTHLNIPHEQLELITRINPEDEPTVIYVKYTGELSMTDVQSLQVLNLIVRRAMQCLKLERVGADYYDSRAAVSTLF